MSIIININSGKEFEKVSEGVHSAVLADIVQLGEVPTEFGPKKKVKFVWMTSETDSDGRTLYVHERFNESLHEKSSLTKRLKTMGINVPTDVAGFDIEVAIGTQAQLVVQHNEDKEGRVWANISSVLKFDPKKHVKVAIPREFKRDQDKPAKAA